MSVEELDEVNSECGSDLEENACMDSISEEIIGESGENASNLENIEVGVTSNLEASEDEASGFVLSNYAFVYPRTSDFELGDKFESGVETEILVRVGLELPLDQNSF
jgi:hypothetical protein